jgi:hypothetical protein
VFRFGAIPPSRPAPGHKSGCFRLVSVFIVSLFFLVLFILRQVYRVARSGGAHLAGFPARFTLMKKIPTDFSGAAPNNIQRQIESDVPSLRQSFLLAETFPDVNTA